MTYKPKILTLAEGGLGNAVTGANNGVFSTNGSGTTTLNASVISLTPTIQFGGGSTGITYAFQLGGYYQIGQLIVFDISVGLSNKGSSTGTMTIVTGLPTGPQRANIFAVSVDSLTFTGEIVGRLSGSGNTNMVIDQFASGGGRSALDNSAFSNNSFIEVSGCFVLG